jgi:predicted metal-dependent HD superfamily phosphohydrolase
MTQPETEIRTAWRSIAGRHHEGPIEALLVRYAEPHRRYHTATHIMVMLRHVLDVFQSMQVQSSTEVIAACLYHDAIYDTTRGDNEELSAAVATRELDGIGWSASRCGSVAAMIVATASHVSETYVNGVRAEYGHVDDSQWLTGRSAVLRGFLGRRRLFATQFMYATFEHRARANIEAELAALSHRSPQND